MAKSGPLPPFALTRLAAANPPHTLASAKDALRRSGLPVKYGADLVAEAERLARVRLCARDERLHRRAGYCPVEIRSYPTSRVHPTLGRRPTFAASRAWVHGSPGPGKLPIYRGTPQERLQAVRTQAVRMAFERTLRRGVNDELDIRLTDDPRAVGLREVAQTDWTRYKGQYKGWACNFRGLTLTVPALWRTRVERRGLATLGGLLTLDAWPLEGAPPGVELYGAWWLRQGRGNAVHSERGYIALDRQSDLSYHGSTPAAALEGLRRKVRSAQWEAALQLSDLRALVAGNEHLVVRVSDARAVGACEYGIRAWCTRVGLDYEAGSATLGAVVQAYEIAPLPEARLTILHALRRSRALRLAA